MKGDFMKCFFLISLLCLFQYAYAGQVSEKIVNGVEVKNNDPIAKSTVFLNAKYQRFSFTCTGIIVSNDMILTAAHCLGPYMGAKITAFFGVNKNQKGITINVIKQVAHSDYQETNKTDRRDFALLLLEKPIPSEYSPINFLPEENILNNDEKIILAGYGINITPMPSKGDGGVGVLRMAEQNIIDANYGQSEVLINIKNKGTCSGDSGGPAMIKKQDQLYLFGVASRMTDKDIVPGSNPTRYECKEEIVYGNIIKENEWLKKTMKEIK
jgi:secreted trypsin-like serine protease